MKQDQIEEGRLSDRGEGIGTVTEEMVRRRAGEIAIINGRGEDNVLPADWEQARRELQGRERLNPETPPEERVPEGERWPAVAESKGRRGVTVPTPDEQTYAEKLVEEGVSDAEHDQAVEATKESLRRDQ